MSGVNSNPGWVGPQNGQPGTKPTAQQWNSEWSSKVDGVGGNSVDQLLITPTISGGTANLESLSVNGSPISAGSTTSAPASVTVTSGTTYSAAQMIGGVIWRTGPTAAFADTTASASAIIAAIPGAIVGSGFDVIIVNGTGYDLTISPGAGVTMAAFPGATSPTVIQPLNSVRWRAIAQNVGSSPAVTMSRVSSSGV